MTEIDEALLCLRARMILKQAEKKLRYCSEDDKKTGMSIRAYYLGREFPNADVNPFVLLEHPFQDDLVKGFSIGASNAAIPNISPDNAGYQACNAFQA